MINCQTGIGCCIINIIHIVESSSGQNRIKFRIEQSMSNEDRKRWNRKYQDSHYSYEAGFEKEADSLIVDRVKSLKMGSLLDVACGNGRNSLYLADKGFKVTSLDISSAALSHLESAAEKARLDINTVELDLDLLIRKIQSGIPQTELNDEPSCHNACFQSEFLHFNSFDSIIISRYKPDVKLLSSLSNFLVYDGVILLSSFNELMHENTGFPIEYCLQQDEFSNIHQHTEKLILNSYERIISNGSNFDIYLFVKR